MTELVNAFTNTQMWVADNRVDEYLAAGHKKPAAIKSTEEKPKKEVSKKTTAKRGK